MAQETMSTQKNGFVHREISQLHDTNYSPIYGYQDLPVTTLEEAVQTIQLYVPKVEEYVNIAKVECKKNTELTLDESATIYLYTMPTPFHSRLNHKLRAEDGGDLKPWLGFLKLFITALGKLPSLATTVWRGVAKDISSVFFEDFEYTWWTVNSCSTDLNVIQCYINKDAGRGTVFAIETLHGKDVSKYSAFPLEKEVILMPGTRVYLKCQPLEIKDGLRIACFEERTAIPAGQHVMLSYHSKAREIVTEIHDILRKNHVSVWFDERGDMKEDNMYESLAVGVENAAIVCCFLTSDYEISRTCKLELEYAHKRHKPIIPCILNETQLGKTSGWLKSVTENVKCIDMHPTSDSNVQLKAIELIDTINEHPHVSKYPASQSIDQPSYLFEMIKYNYISNSRIERFINPSISYPIDQSYINLAIVETKEQHEKEKKLHNIQNSNAIMNTFEQIYSTKTPIDVKDLFKTCKDQNRKMLVFGRAGIGKSTFCRYVAYQWATGIIWSEYELVILLPLRSLTANHYPPGITYSLIDIVEKEYFSCPSLSEKDKSFLQQQFNKSRILWLLDGYDEIVQNIPAHLQRLLEQLCKAPHHIITSRPYMNSLSYPMHMEITGFTDENIPNYINQFFGEVENGSHYSYTEHNGVLSFLKRNPRIWGIAHIPINLELICSVWSNTNWSTTKRMTMTTLYDNLIEWICRRYLEKQQGTPIEKINLMSKKCVYENCRNELAFLESLAFHAMENNTILLDPKLLEEAEKETNCYLDEHKNLLNIGILKSFTQSGVGTRIEVVRDHHFVHLSFQEYFAAGYLVDALRHNHNKKGIEFIKHQKYNQWFRLVFMFTSGLLHESRDNKSIDIFWNAAIGKPLDLVGIRHMDFVISCFDQADVNQTFACYDRLMHSIIRWIERAFRIKQDILRQALLRTFRLCTTILNQPPIQTTLLKLLKNEQTTNITEMLSFISNIQISNPMPALIDKVLLRLKHSDYHIRCSACEALRAMGTKAPTTEIIRGLLGAFKDENFYVRISAFDVLREMGEEPASSEVMNGLIGALKHDNSDVRSSACDALCAMGEKAATSEVISELLGALKDENSDVRSSACDALRAMGEKVATSEVISGLLGARKDEEFYFRSSACDALCAISEKAASTEVISELLSALKDANSDVRNSACKALRAMCKKAASIEVINGLLSALKDEDSYVICSACKALGAMGEKAALNEVISELLSVFKDGDYYVRRSVCDALRAMSENATSKATISTLLVALKEKDSDVKISACDVLRKMDQKAVSSEEISELLSALKDQNSDLRNSACDTLGAIGEKAATSEVICELLCALRDGDSYLRNSACYTLGAMAEKLATSEVISQVMTILVDVWEMSRINTRDESQGFLSLLSAIAVFCDKKDVVVDAAGPFKRCFETNLISAQRLLKVYMDTADPRWLPAVVGAFLVTQNAVTVVGNTLLVYEEQVVVEIPFTQHNLVDKLHKVFDKQSLKIDYKVRRCCSLL